MKFRGGSGAMRPPVVTRTNVGYYAVFAYVICQELFPADACF